MPVHVLDFKGLTTFHRKSMCLRASRISLDGHVVIFAKGSLCDLYMIKYRKGGAAQIQLNLILQARIEFA